MRYVDVHFNLWRIVSGVSTSFINSELSRFISEGQIHAKIDRVGIVLKNNG